MLPSAKPYLKIFSIIFLIFLIIKAFVQCKGNFRSQVQTGTSIGSILMIIIYISNN